MRKTASVLCLASIVALGTTQVSADALFLDGNGDYVPFNGVGVPFGSSPFTLKAWINPTSIPTGGGNGGQITFWGTQGPNNTANGFRLRGVGGVRHYFWGNDHDENFTIADITPDTTGPVNDGWHELAVTYDGNTTNWYWNGDPLGNPRVAGAVNVANQDHRIGSRINAEFFHGFIDEVSIRDTAVDAQTIADEFRQPLDPNDPDLVAYWDFEDGLNDQAGGDNNGTFMGDASIDATVNAPLLAPQVIPEPASIAIWSLIGLTGMGFGYWRWRRK